MILYDKRSQNIKRGLKIRTRIEDKIVSAHTMKVRKDSRDVVLLIRNPGTTALPMGKGTLTHFLEEWVGPKASLDVLEKRKTLLPLLELEPQILHLYTLITMLNHLLAEYSTNINISSPAASIYTTCCNNYIYAFFAHSVFTGFAGFSRSAVINFLSYIHWL
jgi:hypothetical protein